jgi:hypothetical protein
VLLATLLAPLVARATVYGPPTPSITAPGLTPSMMLPRFGWTPGSDMPPGGYPLGTDYRIVVAKNSEFFPSQTIVDDRIAAVINWYVPHEELEARIYYWKVAVVDISGVLGTWSSPQSFTVQAARTPTDILSTDSYTDIKGKLAAAQTAAAKGRSPLVPVLVQFPVNGVLALDPLTDTNPFINFTGVSDLIIDGRGTKITLQKFISFVQLTNCDRVLVKNFTFDYNPLPYTAGTVTGAPAVGAPAGTFDVTLLPAHPLPDSDPAFASDMKGMVVVTSDPPNVNTLGEDNKPRMKRGASLVMEHNGWALQTNGDYRFTALTPSQVNPIEIATGDIYVLDPRHSSATGFNVVGGSDDVFYKLTANAAAVLAFQSNYTQYHGIIQCNIQLLAGRYLAANNGGQNHHNNRFGPWVDGGIWQNTGDDISNFNCLAMYIKEIVANTNNTTVRMALNQPFDSYGNLYDIKLDLKRDDVLQFFDRTTGTLISKRKIQSLSDCTVPATAANGNIKQVPGLEIVFDGSVGAVNTGTQVFNANRTCNQFVFRNTVVQNGRRLGVLAKSSSLIENNRFERLGGGAVEFWNGPEAGLSMENCVVRNNTVTDCGRIDRIDAAIWATIFQDVSTTSQLHKNLLITGNTITNFPGDAILLKAMDTATVTGNTINLYTGQTAVTTSNVTNVTTTPNTITNNGTPTGAVTNYNAWAVTYGLQNPWLGVNPMLNGESTADPDSDGLTNQQEYAFGLNPSSGSSVNPVVRHLDKATGTFIYQRRAGTGLSYKILTSSTLAAGNWTEDVAASQVVGGVDGSGNQTVVVTLTGTKPLAATTLFVRVQAP